MPRVPKGQVKPPRPRAAGRVSVRQKEVLEALEALKAGKGRTLEDEEGNKYLYIALDRDKVETVNQAKSALYNLRWKFNPKNAKTGGDEAMFNRFFGKDAGRGAIRIEEQNSEILVFVPISYAEKRVAAKKERRGEKVEVSKDS